LTPQYYSPGRNVASVEDQRRAVDVSLPKGEAAAKRAIELDLNFADGYLARGLGQVVRGKLLLAEDLFKQALTLDPNHPDTLHFGNQSWTPKVVQLMVRIGEELPIPNG
jgi:hypothetical protein